MANPNPKLEFVNQRLHVTREKILKPMMTQVSQAINCDVLNEKQIVQSKILMTQSAKHRVEVTRESLLRNLWKSVSITIHMHTL
jgi:hypothetical protein